MIESVEWVAYVAAKATEAAAPEATEAATAAPRRIAGALLQGDAPARDGSVREELEAGLDMPIRRRKRDIKPGLPLTAADLSKARAELAEWMDPREFRRRVHGFDKRSPSEELFNDNKYRFLREAALVLAELSKHKQFDQIRLTDVGEEWPDGYAKTVSGEMAIEVTSVQEPGRPLSAEYNPKKKEYKSPKTPWDVPEEEVYKRAESIPEALDGAIRKKVEKHYGHPCALVVDLNIATHGIEQAKIEQAIARTKDKYRAKFQHLWVLWKDKVF